jgi:hypothetical protein
VVGTVIQQGSRTQNPNMLAYGEEGDLNPDSHLYAVNDRFVNDLHHGDAMTQRPTTTSRSPATPSAPTTARSPAPSAAEDRLALLDQGARRLLGGHDRHGEPERLHA